jgi:hypothetical protein
MNVLLDQGTPAPLRRHLHPHHVDTAAELGWSELQNGILLRQAASAGHRVFVTTDQNIQYQQNLAARPIGVVVLTSTSWPRIQKKVIAIRRAVERVKPGECLLVKI